MSTKWTPEPTAADLDSRQTMLIRTVQTGSLSGRRRRRGPL